MKANEAGLDGKPRTIKLVLSDNGGTKFRFTIEGDIERLTDGVTPSSEYTAAEMWGLTLFNLCDHELKTHGEVKKMNRAERREG